MTMRLRLVGNWKHSYKFASNWFHAAQFAVGGAWAELPPDLKTYVPPKVALAIVAVLGLCGIVARAIDQSAKAETPEPTEAAHESA